MGLGDKGYPDSPDSPDSTTSLFNIVCLRVSPTPDLVTGKMALGLTLFYDTGEVYIAEKVIRNDWEMYMLSRICAEKGVVEIWRIRGNTLSTTHKSIISRGRFN